MLNQKFLKLLIVDFSHFIIYFMFEFCMNNLILAYKNHGMMIFQDHYILPCIMMHYTIKH